MKLNNPEMIQLIVFFALLSSGVGTGRHNVDDPFAVTVAHFTFPERQDRDFIRPDDWYRVVRPGYPDYVEATLTKEHIVAPGTRSLVFRMNGGHCAYFSPLLPGGSEYAYVLRGRIKTVGLSGDEAFLLLEFLDAKQQLHGEQYLSERLGGTRDWTTVEIGPVVPPAENVAFVRLACVTQHGDKPDLKGAAYFADLWVGRLPLLQARPSADYWLFDVEAPASVSVSAAGLEVGNYILKLELADADGTWIATHVSEAPAATAKRHTVRWDLPVPGVGCYRLTTSLWRGDRRQYERSYPLTLQRRLTGKVTGVIGISTGAPRFGLAHLEHLLDFAGARWLKLPLWGGTAGRPEFAPASREFPLFVERLERKDIEVVGGLEQPSMAVEAHLPRPMLGIADVFALPADAWSAELEPVLTRFGLKTTYWQLGRDNDTSIGEAVRTGSILAGVKAEMQRILPSVRLGYAMNWWQPTPSGPNVAFLTFSGSATPVERTTVEAPLGADTLRAYLNAIQEQYGTQADPATTRPELWVQISALPANAYDRVDRVVDLAKRIVAAKTGGADRIVLSRFDDPTVGLIDANGVPNELFCVCRTLAEHIGDGRYLGTLPLRDGTENYVFSRGSRATVVLWSDANASAELVVGASARLVDLWGRVTALDEGHLAHRVGTSAVPVLLVDADEPIVRLQLAADFVNGRMSSEMGRQTDELRVENPFDRTLIGEVVPGFPAAWNARPARLALQTPAQSSEELAIEFNIPAGTPHGTRWIPLDFDVSTDRRYRFRIYRPIRLGGDEVLTTTATRLLADGRLDVEVAVTNQLDRPISLRCLLRAYQRPVEQADIVSLAAQETAVRRFQLQDGANLIGAKLRLELFEVGGRHQFTYEISAAH